MATTTIRIQVSSTDKVEVITEADQAIAAAPVAAVVPPRDLPAETLAFLRNTTKYRKRSLAAVAKELGISPVAASIALDTLIDRYQAGQSEASGLYYAV